MQYCKTTPDAVAWIAGGAEAPQLSGCVQIYQEDGMLVEAKNSGLQRKVRQGSLDFTSIRAVSALERDFPEHKDITIHLDRDIRNMLVICRHCYVAKGMHTCP